jgi:DNA-binding transcriptional LysR family regulator
MDYRYLKAFLSTAKHSSFSKAASELKIAQSAISRQIKLLEDSIGEELIVRSSKKVLLTELGKKIYISGKTFDHDISEILTLKVDHHLSIGILHGLLENWLTPKLMEYYKTNHNNIGLKIGDIPSLRQGIETGLFDLVFTSENIQSELVTSRHLFDENMVLISQNELDLKNLHEYRWIAYGENDFLFKLTKHPPKSIIIVDSITTIVNLVKNNIGIAIVPDHMIKPHDHIIQYQMPKLPKSKIYMATLSYKKMPIYIKDFYQFII